MASGREGSAGGARVDSDAAPGKLLDNSGRALIALLGELESPPGDGVELGTHSLGLLDRLLLVVADPMQVRSFAAELKCLEAERRQHRPGEQENGDPPGSDWLARAPRRLATARRSLVEYRFHSYRDCCPVGDGAGLVPI